MIENERNYDPSKRSETESLVEYFRKNVFLEPSVQSQVELPIKKNREMAVIWATFSSLFEDGIPSWYSMYVILPQKCSIFVAMILASSEMIAKTSINYQTIKECQIFLSEFLINRKQKIAFAVQFFILMFCQIAPITISWDIWHDIVGHSSVANLLIIPYTLIGVMMTLIACRQYTPMLKMLVEGNLLENARQVRLTYQSMLMIPIYLSGTLCQFLLMRRNLLTLFNKQPAALAYILATMYLISVLPFNLINCLEIPNNIYNFWHEVSHNSQLLLLLIPVLSVVVNYFMIQDDCYDNDDQYGAKWRLQMSPIGLSLLIAVFDGAATLVDLPLTMHIAEKISARAKSCQLPLSQSCIAGLLCWRAKNSDSYRASLIDNDSENGSGQSSISSLSQ